MLSPEWESHFCYFTISNFGMFQFRNDSYRHYATPDVQMVWIGLAIAIASIPAGIFAVKIGNRQAMLCGICAIIPSLLIMISVDAQIPIIVLIIAGFSLIVNGVIPFALGLVPLRWARLGIGMYFDGFALAMSLFGVLFPQPQTITPFVGAVGGALAFFLAGICIAMSGISQTHRRLRLPEG